MAARTPGVGLSHPTVVPTNVDAEADGAPEGDGDEAADR